MFFPHRRLHKVSVNPGSRGPFGDETEPDSLCCLRKKGDQRRAVVAGEVQAEIESASDKVEPEIKRLVTLVNPDFIHVTDGWRQRSGMMIQHKGDVGLGIELA